VEQLNTATELVARRSLFVFVEASSLDECGEAFDIGLREHGIVEQLLVAFITEDAALALEMPRATLKDPITMLMLAVRRAAKEPLSNVMVLGRVRPALGGR
jgi:hypothetical protein